MISATGVKPNIAFLKGSGIDFQTGILVNEKMQTSHPDIYAAGDVNESIGFSSDERIVNAIQPNAAEEARIAAIAMTGGSAESQGTFQMNILDTLGLISSSFGLWSGAKGGEHVELVDLQQYKYMRLEFFNDVLIGATCVGSSEHLGVLRGLIQGRIPLGEWKETLMGDPTKVMSAYLAAGQAQSAWMN